MPVTVVLADPHPAVRAGLRSWVEAAGGTVVAEVAAAGEVVQAVATHRPAVLLIEIGSAEFHGLGVLAALRERSGPAIPTSPGERQLPTTPAAILCLASSANPTYAARAQALGAEGYLSKSADRETVVAALRAVADGGSAWPTDLVRRLTGSLAVNPTADRPATPLTAREGEVLKQLAFGLSNKEIAQALGISYETVKEHVQHILRKLGVADRTQAAVWAVRHELA